MSTNPNLNLQTDIPNIKCHYQPLSKPLPPRKVECKKISIKNVEVKTKHKPLISDHSKRTFVPAVNCAKTIEEPKKKVRPIMPTVNSRCRVEKEIADTQALTVDDMDRLGYRKETMEDRVSNGIGYWFRLKIIRFQITKHMNFRTDKKIYKKLIPLDVAAKRKQHVVNAYSEPSVKDAEPRLEDYFAPNPSPEYCACPRVHFSPSTILREYNGHSMYRRMRAWNPNDY